MYLIWRNKKYYRIFVVNLLENDHFEDQGDRKIIFRRIIGRCL
jgi:hypothetical protein